METRPHGFETLSPSTGVRLFALQSRHLKTSSVQLFFLAPEDRETATEIAVLARVLREGTIQHPSRRELAIECENLYGARLATRTSHVHSALGIRGSISFAGEKFLPSGSKQFRRSVELLVGVMLRPATDESGTSLRRDIVQREIKQLREKIQAFPDNKPAWAGYNAIRRVYPDHVHPMGEASRLSRVKADGLLHRHRELIRRGQVLAFVTGPEPAKRALKTLAECLQLPATKRVALTHPKALPGREKIKRTRMKDSAEQAHVVLALSGGQTVRAKTTAPSMYANGVFGGYSFSRLFKIVREELGLAYSVHSSYSATRGHVLAHAAVAPAKAKEAAQTMLAELKRLQSDGPTSDEFDACRQSLLEHFNAMADQPENLATLLRSQLVLERVRPLDVIYDEIESVKLADVRRAVKRLKPHTLFTMSP